MGRFMGRGNQYIQLVKFLYCKMLTIGKPPPIFLHRVRGLNLRPQWWEVIVLPLRHYGPSLAQFMQFNNSLQCDNRFMRWTCPNIPLAVERDVKSLVCYSPSSMVLGSNLLIFQILIDLET